MKPRTTLGYWIATILFTSLLGSSGITYLLAVPANVQGIVHLGYPIYLMKFLGVAKILGVVAILSGKYPKLKEWAYAGFTFELLLAAYSHVCSGDGFKAVFPLIMLGIMLVSYAQWQVLCRSSRRSE